jgi:hypothetical protein
MPGDTRRAVLDYHLNTLRTVGLIGELETGPIYTYRLARHS